jgi:glutathione peroxidase-family protein
MRCSIARCLLRFSGFTYQFTGLEELNKEYGDRGLTVLGFPSNEFAGQDPGTDADIESFCQVNHGVTFKLMKKVSSIATQHHRLHQPPNPLHRDLPVCCFLMGMTLIYLP